MLGWILIVIGTGLTAGIAYLLVAINRIMRHSADPDATTRFTGTPAAALMIYGVLILFLLFGVVSIASGAWQARHGTRNPWLVNVVLAFAAFFISMGVLVRYLA